MIHGPDTEAGKQELALQVAQLHASGVQHCIKHLDCPNWQKEQLLDAVLQIAKEHRPLPDHRV